MGGLEMYAQARKWQSKNWDPDMADFKFKVSIHKAGFFFPLKVRQHFLMPTCLFKRKQLALCPVSQRRLERAVLSTFLPAYASHRRRPQELEPWVQSQAWQATARELGSRCLSPGGGNF